MPGINAANLTALGELDYKESCLVLGLLVEIVVFELLRDIARLCHLAVHFIIALEKIGYLAVIFGYHLHKVIVLGIDRTDIYDIYNADYQHLDDKKTHRDDKHELPL